MMEEAEYKWTIYEKVYDIIINKSLSAAGHLLFLLRPK